MLSYILAYSQTNLWKLTDITDFCTPLFCCTFYFKCMLAWLDFVMLPHRCKIYFKQVNDNLIFMNWFKHSWSCVCFVTYTCTVTTRLVGLSEQPIYKQLFAPLTIFQRISTASQENYCRMPHPRTRTRTAIQVPAARTNARRITGIYARAFHCLQSQTKPRHHPFAVDAP